MILCPPGVRKLSGWNWMPYNGKYRCRIGDLIREVGVNPTMNIMVSGGVFNRAPDLWKEINADLFAESAQDALKVADEAIPRIPEVRIPGAPKKCRRRRKSPLLLEASAITSGK